MIIAPVLRWLIWLALPRAPQCALPHLPHSLFPASRSLPKCRNSLSVCVSCVLLVTLTSTSTSGRGCACKKKRSFSDNLFPPDRCLPPVDRTSMSVRQLQDKAGPTLGSMLSKIQSSNLPGPPAPKPVLGAANPRKKRPASARPAGERCCVPSTAIPPGGAIRVCATASASGTYTRHTLLERWSNRKTVSTRDAFYLFLSLKSN